LVFDEGDFSEDGTFLLSETVAHTPRNILEKTFRLDKDAISKLPKDELYIFPAALPRSLAQDKAAIGGRRVESPFQYTFKMAAMEPTRKTPGGEVRIVDSSNFPVSKNVAAGLVTSQESCANCTGIPMQANGSSGLPAKDVWTIMMNGGRARTMDFNANDVGFVPRGGDSLH
jgi:oxalate decarboxylase